MFSDGERCVCWQSSLTQHLTHLVEVLEVQSCMVGDGRECVYVYTQLIMYCNTGSPIEVDDERIALYSDHITLNFTWVQRSINNDGCAEEGEPGDEANLYTHVATLQSWVD